MKKLFALLLAAAMVLSMAACGTGKTDTTTTGDNTTTGGNSVSGEPVEYVDPYADLAEDYDALSSAVYEDVLGDFYEAYEAAKACENKSEKWAMMAVAEAKLLESAVMLPIYSSGGNYAISRAVPYTVPNINYGNDYERYYSMLVTTMPLTTEDRDTIKTKYKTELKGTGTYYEWVKQFLLDEGYTLKDTYTFGYSSDPQTWDVLATSKSADSEAIINTYDGLMEYDCEGVLQPALAESYEVSDDGLTYTFKIRQGVKWVDSQGREVADVKADDFVAGMQHMMDACGGLEYLIQNIIVGADDYITGTTTDFSTVGVKAEDDYTLVYTLNEPCTYFMTMLGYGVFAPMSRDYYTSQGGQFGTDYDASAESYTYGSSKDNIAYCGPYLCTNATAENTVVFSANPSYWNTDKVAIKTLTWLYNDGSDATKAINDNISGVIDGCGMSSAAVEVAKSTALPEGYTSEKGAENWYDEFSYVASTNATTYSAFYTVHRTALADVNDGAVPSSKTDNEEAVVRANAAMKNEHFRRALAFSSDRATYNAQSVGEELKLASLRNTYTPGDFVALEEDVTISINGTDTTFTAGTNYGEIVQAQIDADGVKIKAWDPTQESGTGSSDFYDGWYNVDNAVEELNTAIEELAAIGIEVSSENPIILDYPYYSASQTWTNKANAFKQSMESALNGCVTVNLVECVDSAEWYYAGYYADFGYEANYDIYDLSGWGPDYGDPSTFLDTFLPDYAGYMLKCIGIF